MLEHSSCRKCITWLKFSWLHLEAWWAVPLGIGCEFVEEKKQLSSNRASLCRQIKLASN